MFAVDHFFFVQVQFAAHLPGHTLRRSKKFTGPGNHHPVAVSQTPDDTDSQPQGIHGSS